IDPPDEGRKKFKTAVTDSGTEVRHDPDEKPGVSNLIEIMAVATGRPISEVEAQFDGHGYGAVKEGVAEAVVELLAPVHERYHAACPGRSRSATTRSARTRTSCGGCSSRARTRPARRALRCSGRCTNEWALSGRNAAVLAVILALCVVAGVLHYADAEPVVVFLLGAAALAGLAWAIGIATEAVGARFGPGLTGVLQSTLGNLPELFVVLFALSAGEVVVAQTSILGSLFANALLVLGLAIVAG